MYTIVLSGPKACAQQARTALAAAGHDVQSGEHDHGLPAHPQGKKTRQAIGFITVHGDDIDTAHAAVESLGWRLRAHWHTPEPAEPSVEHQLLDRITALEQQIATLTEAR